MWECLFHSTKIPVNQYTKSLVPSLLNTAKSLILKHWQDPETPTLRSWSNRVDDIYNMEYLRFSGEEGWVGFEEKLRDWHIFKHTLKFAEMLGA